MLLHFNENRRVMWFNTYLSEEEAQGYICSDTIWVNLKLPDVPPKKGFIAFFVYTTDGELTYDYESETEPEETLTQTEQAILQTAITTEYTAALVEMMLI